MSNELDAKIQKILKDLPEFVDAAKGSSTEELKQIVVRSEQHISTVEKEKGADQKLLATKELMSELSAPYRDSLKVLNAKIKFCIHLLEEKGVDLEK